MTMFKEEHPLILDLLETSRRDAFLVGEKAWALMQTALYLGNSAKIPDAFVISTELCNSILQHKEIKAYIKQALKQLDIAKVKSVKAVSRDIRKKIMNHPFPDKVEDTLIKAFHALQKKSKSQSFSLAIRPSVFGYKREILAESLHHVSLCVHSEKQFLRSVRLGLASLFSEPALLYREARGIDHRAVSMALIVQQMVGSGSAQSGAVQTTVQKNTMNISASYGLPLYRQKKSILPDSFELFKPALEQQKISIIKKTLGAKRSKIKQQSERIKETSVSTRDQQRFCLEETQIARVATCSIELEKKFDFPLFIEWMYDEKGMLYILDVQILKARNEKKHAYETYKLKGLSEVLCTGSSAGTKIVSGNIFALPSGKRGLPVPPHAILFVKNLRDATNFINQNIKAIIVEETVHNDYTLQLAREQNIPIMWGLHNACSKLKNGIPVTLESNSVGKAVLYKGLLPFEVTSRYDSGTASTRTKLYTHIGDSHNAAELASLPVDGISVVEQDSIIKNYLRIHPLALVDSARISDPKTKRKIAECTRGYASKSDYAVQKLSEGIAEVAAAYYPAKVQLRMSENCGEFRNLIAGQLFSKQCKNEWQSASRYYSKQYKQACALECYAIKKAREDWGLTNIEILIPFCRTPEEAKKVLEFMEECGLKQGKHGLKIQISCDIPSNLILAEEYAKLFDGLALGAHTNENSEFSEQDNPVVRQMLKEVISLAHKHQKTVSFLNQHSNPNHDFVNFLVREGVDGISVDMDHINSTREQISYIEQTVGKTGHATGGKFLSLVIGCAVLAAGLINVGAGCVYTNPKPDDREVLKEVTPAEIRAQVTKEVSAKKDAEREAGRSKLKISGFVPLELLYPSGWNVEYWSDGVTLVSQTDPNEYMSIFRQIIDHPISYSPTSLGNVAAQKVSAPMSAVEENLDIWEFPMGAKNYVIEINAHSDKTDEIINSIKFTDAIDTKINTLLNHWDVREKRICARMAVFARADKKSGECLLYTNPCDVPAGWHICGGVDK